MFDQNQLFFKISAQNRRENIDKKYFENPKMKGEKEGAIKEIME